MENIKVEIEKQNLLLIRWVDIIIYYKYNKIVKFYKCIIVKVTKYIINI